MLDPATQTYAGKVTFVLAASGHIAGVVNPPAWVSHAPAREVSASARLTEPAISSRGRSGAAAVEGTFDGSRHGLEDSAARTQALIDEAQAWRAHMQTLALRTGDGGVRRFASRDHADRAAADHNTSPGAVPMRPVRLTPLGSRRAQTQAALEHADSAELTSHVTDALRGALEGREDNGGGSWVLIPDTAARRLLAHLDVRSQASAAGKLGNVVTSMFRRTVLPLSPRWAMGNLVEGALRSAIAGAGPTNYLAGRRILKALDKLDAETGAQARAMVAPGGMYSLGLRGEVRRGLEDWSGDGHLDRFARRLIELREQSGPRQIAGAYRAYTDVVFTSMGWMESHFQTAMLGKALKQLNIREGGVGALSEKAMLEAADGLRGTSTQVELARRVSDMYGKYSGMSPGARRAIRTYAPFAPWWLSAVKFVTVVLPRDHPVLTGLIASNEQATREWRKDHNLEPYVDNSAPGWLQGSVPVGGGLLPLARYTPFGAFTDPAGTAAGQVLPQISGVLAALRGEDWTGKKLRGPDGKPLDDLGKARKAALAFIEGTIPGVQLGETIAKRGVGDALNPLRTYSKSVGSTDPLDALSKALSHTNSSTNLDAFSKALSKTNGN